jgi:hypothetical protein
LCRYTAESAQAACEWYAKVNKVKDVPVMVTAEVADEECATLLTVGLHRFHSVYECHSYHRVCRYLNQLAPPRSTKTFLQTSHRLKSAWF